ncbi:hypothetical protein FRD01_07860 [Microvenator marinus]|uniref:Uncharacterized protein n=1 Tax=Microvenator marinus TaxID=2600177 RepID=A0A5B8XUQ9_9DELT|nr:hypothetical protein [Microvenator marinus]QED27159.1 hypothetical protein FRD01_07860 [Microvenator marinus]
MRIPLDERKLNKLVQEMRNRDHAPVIYFTIYLVGQGQKPHFNLARDLVNECADYLSALNMDELDATREKAAVWVRFSDWKNPLVSAETKKRFIAEGYVYAEVHARYFAVDHLIDMPLTESLVLREYPELKEHLDEDGLLILGDEFEPVDGVVFYKSHALWYHQFLRRGFTSSPNFDFLAPFIRYYHDTKRTNTFRVAIDHSRLMSREDYSRVYEFDTWFGPPFDTATLDDPDAVGLTVVARNKTSLFELTNHLHFTDFLWTYKEGIKTLQIEEVHDKADALGNYIINRYVHAERDIDAGVFRHLDGAAKVYTLTGYDKRKEIHLPEARSCHRKPKLWRIDGEIDLKTLSSLVSLFYKSNEMIIEYFNPDAFEEMFELRIRDPIKWKAEFEPAKR